MPEKTPAEKLRLKTGMNAAIYHAPEGVDLGIPEGVALIDDTAASDFVLVFGTTQAEVEKRVTALAPALSDKAIVWIGYPKGAKAKGFDVSRDTIAAFVPSVGLIVNAAVGIDDVWSALRVRPLKPGEA